MATMTGVDGNCTLAESGAPTINIYEWSCDLTRAAIPDDNFADSNNGRQFIGGQARLTGTARGTMQAGATTAPTLGGMATSADAPTAAFYLECDDTNNKNYKFAALIRSINVVVAKADRVTVDVSFESSGAVAVNEA